MKKILLSVLIAVFCISCSEGEGDGGGSEKFVEIYVNKGVVTSKPNTFDTGISGQWVSSDPFVATVENGIIIAEHVGEADVAFRNKIYHVKVLSSLPLLDPPVVEFGKPMEYIASKEQREKHKGTYKGLLYHGETEYVDKIWYYFSDAGASLNKIQIVMNGSRAYLHAATWLGHFYEQADPVTIDGVYNLVYIDAYDREDAQIIVYCPNTIPLGTDCVITYLPITH